MEKMKTKCIYFIFIFFPKMYLRMCHQNSESAKTFWFGGQTEMWSETKFSTMVFTQSQAKKITKQHNDQLNRSLTYSWTYQ